MKLTSDQVIEIRARYSRGVRAQRLADEYGVAYNTIHRICNSPDGRVDRPTADLIREIRTRVAAGDKQLDIARDLGIHPMKVSEVARGRTYRWVSDAGQEEGIPNKVSAVTSNAKRSIIWDTMGYRLGQGRKPDTLRKPIQTPPGVHKETKRKALEQAKMCVLDRHFAELQSIFKSQIEFFEALDAWWPGASRRPIKELVEIIEQYYEKHGLQPDAEVGVPHSDGSVEVPMLLPSGRPRPRAKKRVS